MKCEKGSLRTIPSNGRESMKCDFCNERFTHEPYVITRIIPGLTAIKFNFCDRTCMVAEKMSRPVNKSTFDR